MKLKKLISEIISLSILSSIMVISVNAEKGIDKVIYNQDFNTLKRSVYNDTITKDMVYNSIATDVGDDLFWWYRGSMIHEVDATHGGYDGTRALYMNARNGGRYYNDDGSIGVSNLPQGTAHTKIEIPFVSGAGESPVTTGVYVISCDYFPSVGRDTFALTGRTTFADSWPGDLDYLVSNKGTGLEDMERVWHEIEITVDLDNTTAYFKATKKSDGSVVRDDHCLYTRGIGILEIQSDHQTVSESEFSKAENSAIIDNIKISKRELIPDPDIKIVNDNNGVETDFDNVSNKIKEISIDFKTGVKESTLTTETVTLKEDNGDEVSCSRSYENNVYTLSISGDLKEETDYILTVSGVKYDDGEDVDSIEQKFSTKYNDIIKEEISFTQNFESVTNSNLSSWKSSYNLYKNGWFRIYSTTANTNTCLYNNNGNRGMYLAIKTSDKNASAMQLVVANESGTESLKSGRYILKYDFYPANGKNSLSLVKASDASEAMAKYTGGASLMKDKTFTSREWYNAEVTVDFEKDKATLVISKKSDGTAVYTNEISYTDDLSIFNFYMNGTNICTAANSAIFDNFSFSEVLTVPQMQVSVTDGAGNKHTDFTQEFAGISAIEIDFGMDVVESTLNNDTVYLIDEDENKVLVDSSLNGTVYSIAPKSELDDFSAYTLVLTGGAMYDIGSSEQKASRKRKITLNTGDTRPNIIISVIGGDDKEVFTTTNLLCAIKEIKINFQKDMKEDTLTEDTVILTEKQSGNVISAGRAYSDGIYTITPDKLSEGVLYELLVKSDIKYANGKSVRECVQEISIFSGLVNYYQDFEDAAKVESWDSSNVFDKYEESPIVRYFGYEVKSGTGYDGTSAYVLCTKDNPNSPIVNRDMEIPFGKALKTMGVYQVECDYFPSAGLDCVNLRGNHKFAAGYGVTDGLQLFSAAIDDREWMSLIVTIDIDNKSASYDIISKATGKSVMSGSQTYRNPLGLIEFYMQEDTDTKGAIWKEENSMILDNIRITRLPYEAEPSINESQLEFCVDDVIQSDRESVSPLANNIKIIPTQEILMSSISRDNIYLTEENGDNKLYCTMTYKDGVISIKPDEILKPSTKYILNVESLENPDGFKMTSSFRKGFKTSGDSLIVDALPLDDASWTIKNIKKTGKVELTCNAFNATSDMEVLRFVISYYNDDYSKLLKIEEKKIEVNAKTAKTAETITFDTISDFAHLQVTVLGSLSKMDVITLVKEPQ